MIEMINIKKEFGKDSCKRVLFKDFSFKINDGEMVAIMGKSGCGKTTLLNIIGGLESLSSGEYLFNSNEIYKYNEKQLLKFRRNSVSFVFQNFALINEYTVMDNILLPLEYKYGNKKCGKKRAIELLNNLGINYLINHKIEYLSGGEKQRVAVARALITNSKVVLADEPTGALDEKSSIDLMHLFKSINKLGVSVIIVTHDIDVANYCDRIIKL